MRRQFKNKCLNEFAKDTSVYVCPKGEKDLIAYLKTFV